MSAYADIRQPQFTHLLPTRLYPLDEKLAMYVHSVQIPNRVTADRIVNAAVRRAPGLPSAVPSTSTEARYDGRPVQRLSTSSMSTMFHRWSMRASLLEDQGAENRTAERHSPA
jgi:hypothetical protein